MAVNKDSNVYTITFAVILVVVVGGILATIANGLKPIQDEYSRIFNDKGYLDDLLSSGATKARHFASKTLDKVYRKIGLIKKNR